MASPEFGQSGEPSDIKMAPRGTFAFFNKLYIDSGGWTLLTHDPQTSTRDHSLGFVISRYPRDYEELDPRGRAKVTVLVYQRITGVNERKWLASIDNADRLCSFDTKLDLAKNAKTEDFEPPVPELSEVLRLVRLTLKEVNTHGGIITPNLGYNEAVRLRAKLN